MSVLIIAEAGVNHNGDMMIAERLVKAAADAGADLVKFQTFDTASSIARHAPKAEYQKHATGAAQTQFEMVQSLELSRDDHAFLVDACRRHKIDFFSTGFDQGSIDFLIELGIDRIKIPSGEITNLPLLRHIASKGKPIILSTGMASLGDIEAALDVLEEGGVDRSSIVVLQCNTEYPTPMADANLQAMANIGRTFGVKTGYSDHTLGIEVAIAAVALGACIIEKHFTLDRNLPGPDHQASLEPAAFAEMVRAIRNIEAAIGDGIKRPSASEMKNRAIARKSIVARHAIRTGEPFHPDNVTTKRPGTGLSPMRWDEVMGRLAPRDFEPDEIIEL